MPNVTIVEGFTFQHDDGYKEYIPPGTYEVDEAMANHFQVRGHSDDPMPIKPRPGMSQYEAQMSAFNAARQTRTEQEDQVAAQAADEARTAFRKANVETAARRPNERAQINQPIEEEPVAEEPAAEEPPPA